MQEKSHKKSLVKQNILQVIEIKRITKYEFYKKTRITRGVLDQNNGMSEENIARFLAYFTDIDANWLVTGEGEMLKPKVQDQLVSPSSQYSQSVENQCKDNENNPMMAEASENIKSLIGILNRTLIEKDKQIDRLLSIIEQGKV